MKSVKNERELMTQIMAEIMATADSLSDDYSPPVSSESAAVAGHMQELLSEMYDCKDILQHRKFITAKLPVISGRKHFGSIAIFVKRIIRKLTVWLIEPVCEQQTAFNYAVTSMAEMQFMLMMHVKQLLQKQISIENRQISIENRQISIENRQISIENRQASVEETQRTMHQTMLAAEQRLEQRIEQNKQENKNEHAEVYMHFDVIKGKIAVEKHKRIYGTCETGKDGMLKSSICRMQDLYIYDNWVKIMGLHLIHSHLPDSNCIMNRKGWEYIFIVQALYEREMLQEGRKGLGFAVGNEPLVSLFAKYGCRITATDIDASAEASKHWIDAGQHGNAASDLFFEDLCDKEQFDNNVIYEPLDMNEIPENITDFDFCWSACAVEHLGSIQKGKDFVYNMIKCLKRGGIAVHTMEYGLSGKTGVDDKQDAIFGYDDVVEMRNTLTEQGHHVEELDFCLGDEDAEDYISYPPHSQPHFKLLLNGVASTSFGLIIKKSGSNPEQ